jgi:hypothetical protein
MAVSYDPAVLRGWYQRDERFATRNCRYNAWLAITHWPGVRGRFRRDMSGAVLIDERPITDADIAALTVQLRRDCDLPAISEKCVRGGLKIMRRLP